MRNNEQKVIRGIELNSKKNNGKLNNELDYIDTMEHLTKRFIADSELLRIIETIDAENVEINDAGGKIIKYLPGIIFVKVNHNLDKYEKIKDNNGVLILNHKHFELDKKSKKSRLIITYADEADEIPCKEIFKRLMVGSGHNRGKKALFIREDLFDKVNKILLGGIDEYASINGYPDYKKGYAKWNSYYALPSTDSKAVKKVPNIIVINDYERENVSDIFDMVYQYKDVNSEWKEGHPLKFKYEKDYKVQRGEKRQDVTIMPFDGAGLVSVQCAARWSLELNIRNSKGKRYIPSNFQFRMIPGFKGNLYTFDIQEFRKIYGDIIIDIKGVCHDLSKEKVDVILTKSQAKFLDLFDNNIEKWREVFDNPVVFYKQDKNGRDIKEIECQYQRTFNISDYAEDICDVSRTMQSAYQHLQTVCFTDGEIETYTKRTVNNIEKVTESMDGFLKYRGCTEEKSNRDSTEWNRIPAYYRAAFSMPEDHKNILFGDKYFRGRVKEDVEGLINRALSGKEEIDGNYQTLVPDIYGLAQYAFGERNDSEIGILKAEEVYSNWWMNWKDEDGNINPPDTLALIRNPHIFMEARTVKLIHDRIKMDHPTWTDIVKFVDRTIEMKTWFKYQKTGIITDSFSTIPLALGTADFDGDHIASTKSKEYISAVNRTRKKGNGNTVDYKVIESDSVKKNKQEIEHDISDICKLMEFDALAYLNNIGSVIERVTALWGIVEEETKDIHKVMEYIAIADIIGQLTIDAAKTGEFEEFYPEISIYLKSIVAMEPYFKKYLAKKANKRIAENRAIKNAKLYYEGNQEVIDSQKKFSEFNSNMNRICKYMEKQVEAIDTELDNVPFNLDAFKNIFMTGEVNDKTGLFKRIKHRLCDLSQKHYDIFKSHLEDESDEDLKDKMQHYRWFYANARNLLLCECKLSEEKSIDKVLNIIVALCYEDKELLNNDSAKSIMWNCFSDEMIDRASGKNKEYVIDWEALPEKTKKTEKLNKKVFSKKLSKPKNMVLEDLGVEYVNNPIIILDEDLKNIRDRIRPSSIINNRKIGTSQALLLRRLYAVFLVISKRCECDVITEKGTYHRVKDVRIYENTNRKLNISSLSKMAGFTDYQRKQIMTKMLLQLQELGMIKINSKNMERLRIKVIYDSYGKIELQNQLVEKSLIDAYSYDYEEICKSLRNKFRK